MLPRLPIWKSQTACLSALARSPTPPTSRWLAAKRTRTTRRLRSTRITKLRRYYTAVRPCASPRYSAPRSFSCLGFSLGRSGGSLPKADRHVRGDRFPRFAPEPEPSSRRLHAGHRLGNKQVIPRLLPEVTTLLGFDAVATLTTRHQWFTRVRLLGSYLTHYSCALSATLTTPALDRRSLRWFDASPCRATSEGQPPSLMQPASVGPIFYIDPSFSLRGTPSSA